jgi:hypothetical protein
MTNRDIQVVIEKDDDDKDFSKITPHFPNKLGTESLRPNARPLPPWFVRSTVYDDDLCLSELFDSDTSTSRRMND